MSAGDWEKVGEIGVDAGCVMVGDPCYTQGADTTDHAKDWNDFLARTWPETFGPNAVQDGGPMPDVVPAMGSSGTGMVVSSGYGDGTYPVFIKRSSDGRVAELRVVFIGEEAETSWLIETW